MFGCEATDFGVLPAGAVPNSSSGRTGRSGPRCGKIGCLRSQRAWAARAPDPSSAVERGDVPIRYGFDQLAVGVDADRAISAVAGRRCRWHRHVGDRTGGSVVEGGRRCHGVAAGELAQADGGVDGAGAGCQAGCGRADQGPAVRRRGVEQGPALSRRSPRPTWRRPRRCARRSTPRRWTSAARRSGVSRCARSPTR